MAGIHGFVRSSLESATSRLRPDLGSRDLHELLVRPEPADPALEHAAAERLARRTVVWTAWMFGLVILLQRFAVPGIAAFPLILLIVLVWCGLGLRAGIIEIDRRRFLMWLLAAGASAGVMVLQTWLGAAPVISLSSWGLLIIVWLPAVCRFVDRSAQTYRRALSAIVRICVAFAIVCMIMMGIQLAGVPYHDFMTDIFPESFLLQHYSLASPVSYGNILRRANGWIGLEASMASFQLAIGLIGAILLGRRIWVLIVLVLGLFATVAGSGFLLLVTALPVLVVMPIRRVVVRYGVPVLVLGAILMTTPFGQTLLSRGDEASNEDSSASLRAIEPYRVLWPSWSGNIANMVLGGGAGSSQRLADVTVFQGHLLVPLPAKIFYDYGLAVGLVLAVFLIFCYVDAPSVTLAFALFLNLWTIQPGSNIPVFVIPVLLLVTLWAPRGAPRFEDLPVQRLSVAERYRRLRAAAERRRMRLLGIARSNDPRALPVGLSVEPMTDGPGSRSHRAGRYDIHRRQSMLGGRR